MVIQKYSKKFQLTIYSVVKQPPKSTKKRGRATNAIIIDEDEENEEDDGSPPKKPKKTTAFNLGNDVIEAVTRLQEQYSGKCGEHRLGCFRVGDTHFRLTMNMFTA